MISNNTDLPISLARKKLHISSGNQFLMVIKNASKYRFIGTVTCNESSSFIFNSNTIDIYEADQDKCNVILLQLGEIKWFCALRFKNPAIIMKVYKGYFDRKSNLHIFKQSNTDLDIVSCGLIGSPKPHYLQTSDITSEMCLVCSMFENSYQFTLRDTENGKLTKTLPGEITSFRGSLKQCCELLQIIMGFHHDPLPLLNNLSIAPGNPLRYQNKPSIESSSLDYINIGSNIVSKCCLACSISYTILSSYVPQIDVTITVKNKIINKRKEEVKDEIISNTDFDEAPYCTINDGILKYSNNFTLPQIDLANVEGHNFIGSHILLLTTDLFSCPPDIWTHAVIKYWHKRYRVLFAHLYEPSSTLDYAVNSLMDKTINEDEFIDIVNSCKLSNLEMSRQWIFPNTCRHVLVCKASLKGSDSTPKMDILDTNLCKICNESISYIACKTPVPSITFKNSNRLKAEQMSFNVDKGPDYTMGASTDDIFNSSMVTPISSVYITMRSLVPVHAAKHFTWPSSYPLDQISIVRDFVRLLRSHWFKHVDSQDIEVEQVNNDIDYDEKTHFWGINCSSCNKNFHAKCLHPPNARIPPIKPDITDETINEIEFENAFHVPIYHYSLGKKTHLSFNKWKCQDCSECVYCKLPLNTEILPDNNDELARNTKRRRKGELKDHGKSQIVRCVSCNFGAHGVCCNPAVPRLHFLSFWRCDDCRRCLACGWQDKHYCDYTNWDSQFLFCRRCNYLIGQLNYCAVCYGIWSPDGVNVPMVGSRHTIYSTSTHGERLSQTWIQCGGCSLWLHSSCDSTENEPPNALLRDTSYRCPICRSDNRQLRYYRILELLFLLDKNNELRYKVPQSFVLYWRLVKNPINLSQIKYKLETLGYDSDEDFIRDILLIPHNVKLMSMPNAKVFKLATSFEKKCKSLISRILTDKPSPVNLIGKKLSSYPGVRPNISRKTSFINTNSDLLSNRIKELLKLLPYLSDYTENLDPTLKSIRDAIFGLNKIGRIQLKSYIDFHYNALFSRNRRLSVIHDLPDWVDIDSCHLCQSIDNPTDLIHCRTCATPVHLSCLGIFIVLKDRKTPYRYQCANCSYCTCCGGTCNSGHPLDISNISDISFGEKSGWISKHMSDNLSNTKLDGIGFLPDLGESKMYSELLYDRFHLRLCPPIPPGPMEKHSGPIRTIPCSYCLSPYHIPCVPKIDFNSSDFRPAQRSTNYNSSIWNFSKEVQSLSWRKNFFNNIQADFNRRWIDRPVISPLENFRKLGKVYRNVGVFPNNKIINSFGFMQFVCSEECYNAISETYKLLPGSINTCCSFCSRFFDIAYHQGPPLILPYTYTKTCPTCLNLQNGSFNGLETNIKMTNNVTSTNVTSTNNSYDIQVPHIERLDRLKLVSNRWIYGLLHCIATCTPLVPRENGPLVQSASESMIDLFINSDYFNPIYRILFDLVGSLLRSRITDDLLFSIQGLFNSSLSMFPQNITGFDLKLAHTELERQISSYNGELGPEKSDLMIIVSKLIWVVCCQFIIFMKYYSEGKNKKIKTIENENKNVNDFESHKPTVYKNSINPNPMCELLGKSFMRMIITARLKSLKNKGELITSDYYTINKSFSTINIDVIKNIQKFKTTLNHSCILCTWLSCPELLGNLIQFNNGKTISSIHGECLAWSIDHDLLTKTWNSVFNSLITIQPLPDTVPFKECMYIPSFIPPIEIPVQILYELLSLSKLNSCGICDKGYASIKCYGNCGNAYHLPCIYSSQLHFYYTKRIVWCDVCWIKSRNYRLEQMKHFIYLSYNDKTPISDDFINCEGMGGGASFVITRQTRQRIRIIPNPKIKLNLPSFIIENNPNMEFIKTNRKFQQGYLVIRKLLDHTPYPAGYIYHRRWWHREIPNSRSYYIIYTNLKDGALQFAIHDPESSETFISNDLLVTTSDFIKSFKCNVEFLSSIVKVGDSVQLRNFAETFFGFNDPVNIRRNKEKYLKYVKKRLERLKLPEELINNKTVKTDKGTNELENEIQVVYDSKNKSTEEFKKKKKFDTLSSSMLYRYTQSLCHPERLRVKESPIHGIGLFANQLIPSGEPVIEYIGELIRDVVSDLREKIYNDKWGSGGSCYMFKLNEQLVVDATRMGNMARFINHSCEPNCICRIITSDAGVKHIIIFAKRDIHPGDEITYNYQFGIEAETDKLSCHCGAPSCLGRMN